MTARPLGSAAAREAESVIEMASVTQPVDRADPPTGHGEKVAFIGLGTMGLPMARNLVRAGYGVTGCDVDQERGRLLGAPIAETPAQAAASADVVITSLPSPAIVESVAFGKDGIHQAMRRGATFIDMSTGAPAMARQIAARFDEVGVGAMDAPVSGGSRGATDASLTVMVGGSVELFQRWLPLLRVLGTLVVRVGDVGAGQVAKLCNNLVSGVTLTAISEACAIATREGIEPSVLYEVLRNSVGDSRVLRTRFPIAGADPAHPASARYAPLFTLDLLLKDLRLVAVLADELRVEAPVVRSAIDRYEAAQAAGYGSLDCSAVYLLEGEASEIS